MGCSPRGHNHSAVLVAAGEIPPDCWDLQPRTAQAHGRPSPHRSTGLLPPAVVRLPSAARISRGEAPHPGRRGALLRLHADDGQRFYMEVPPRTCEQETTTRRYAAWCGSAAGPQGRECARGHRQTTKEVAGPVPSASSSDRSPALILTTHEAWRIGSSFTFARRRSPLSGSRDARPNRNLRKRPRLTTRSSSPRTTRACARCSRKRRREAKRRETAGDPDHLELPYARAALAGLALCEEPRRMLVVGLGGGSLPMFLRAHYPAATIDGGGDRSECGGCRKAICSDFGRTSECASGSGDGRQFIENARQADYRPHLSDAFGARDVPKPLDDAGIPANHAPGARAERPVAVANVCAPRFQPRSTTGWCAPIRKRSRGVHPGCPRRRQQHLSRAAPRAAARPRRVGAARPEISTDESGFRFDLGELVEYAFLHAREKNPAGTRAEGRRPQVRRLPKPRPSRAR